MPYTITKGKPTIHEYKGYKYELPNEIYNWTPAPNWYEMIATRSQRDFIDTYIQLLNQSLKYITNRESRKTLMFKLLPSYSEIPFSEARSYIIYYYYKRLEEQNRAERE
jgi:hypothetical protein